ncbi:DnaD domain-containing protein [Aquibacillus koreensis]|uniref:DnaD domain-containing protein n=1 Tax=Aquibacillus koreensis TaxID=279446 RepID=A0A9X3WGX5_9BACI|nr:DnaD domain-containing protein [Aquibacillus koreensis]MCT2537352.1 DnaD domain-containing protein [Aquibacillus koreensis]MDC3418798.1 DnaD domain-containing protein [Aquibacillus koreensis]
MNNQKSYQSFLKDQLIIPSILLKDYVNLGLNEQEVMIILQIHRFYMEGNHFPTPDELADYVTISAQDCSQILRKLIQKNILQIEQNHNEMNVLNEQYSLEPLWVNLYTEKVIQQDKSISEEQTNIFILFEQEFGRPLSPFEIETVNIWIDEEEQSPSLIKAALREAVLMGKLNYRYIDRILREWKRKGIRTVEQARNHSKSFHANQTKQENQKQEEPKRDVSLYYNWLED